MATRRYIKWDEKLKINVDELDSQHQTLYEFINDLHEKLLADRNDEVLLPAIKTLVNYVKEHFTYEEAYMKNINYPGFDTQCKEHRMFIRKIHEFSEKYTQNTPLLAREILLFLGRWYFTHIQQLDYQIGVFVNKGNVEKQEE